MIKRYSKPHYPQRRTGRYYRTNFRINASELRVLDDEGKQIGILSKQEALKKAQEQSLDLVEIAPMAKPPVAKIIDFKKFLYQEEKKKRQQRVKSKSNETKEVWLSPFIGEHDFKLRMERGNELLKEGGKLKVVVRFKGRQITKKQFGFEVMNKLINSLEDAKVDRPPRFEGRNLVAIVSKK